jgi:FAD:protein FMN transferase
MNATLANTIRRCRPLLGTFVEIAIEGHTDQASGIINAAFAAIERVQRLMSFHDPLSEVSRLNKMAVQERVKVSMDTFQVLSCAKELHDITDGIFDITIAGELMEQDLLPRHEFLDGHRNHDATTRDIELSKEGYVRFLRPLCIDLGGIAKGFAVDEAVNVLQESGVMGGCVNAGGDLRCFGDLTWPCGVRHPQNPDQILFLPGLNNEALATSANSYQRLEDDKTACAHIHGRTRSLLQRPYSASVRADSCIYADALTKMVLALEDESFPLLSSLDAVGYIVYPDNRILYSERG